MQIHKQATIGLIIAAFLWSTSPLVIKIIELHPLAISGGRSAITFLFMLGLIKYFGFRLSLPLVIAGILMAITNLSFVAAVKYTTAANAVFLQFAAPVYVAIFGSFFLNEPPGKLGWISVMIIFIGVSLQVTGYNSLELLAYSAS